MGDGKHRARSGTRRGVWRCVNRGGRCVRGPAAGLEARGPAGDSVESGSAAIDDVLVGWRPSELRRLRARSGRGRCARAGGRLERAGDRHAWRSAAQRVQRPPRNFRLLSPLRWRVRRLRSEGCAPPCPRRTGCRSRRWASRGAGTGRPACPARPRWSHPWPRGACTFGGPSGS